MDGCLQRATASCMAVFFLSAFLREEGEGRRKKRKIIPCNHPCPRRRGWFFQDPKKGLDRRQSGTQRQKRCRAGSPDIGPEEEMEKEMALGGLCMFVFGRDTERDTDRDLTDLRSGSDSWRTQTNGSGLFFPKKADGKNAASSLFSSSQLEDDGCPCPDPPPQGSENSLHRKLGRRGKEGH